MTGRKSKFTNETQRTIVAAVEAGATFRLAAYAAGISERLFYTWKARGEEAQARADAGQPVPAPECPFLQFLQAIKRAEGERATTWLRVIEAAADAGDWKAAAWKLERTAPQEYGRTVQDVRLDARLIEQAADDLAREYGLSDEGRATLLRFVRRRKTG